MLAKLSPVSLIKCGTNYHGHSEQPHGLPERDMLSFRAPSQITEYHLVSINPVRSALEVQQGRSTNPHSSLEFHVIQNRLRYPAHLLVRAPLEPPSSCAWGGPHGEEEQSHTKSKPRSMLHGMMCRCMEIFKLPIQTRTIQGRTLTYTSGRQSYNEAVSALICT